MNGDLLDRQTRLLTYLTSVSAIFDGPGDIRLDDALRGIDPRLLHLQASISHQKRVKKISVIFPRTTALLTDRVAETLRDFADVCPSMPAGFIENGRQFCDFLSLRRQAGTLRPPYLHEVAACELAMAQARAFVADEKAETSAKSLSNSKRRAPGVVLLRCVYDIQPIMTNAQNAEVVERDTPLAIVRPIGAEHAAIFELAPAVFNLLASLTDWAPVAPSFAMLASRALTHDLVECGLMEVRR